MQFAGKLKEHAGGLDNIICIELVRCDHCMQTKARNARNLHRCIAVKKLFSRKAVLGLLGLANNCVALFQRTGIVAAAKHTFGKLALNVAHAGDGRQEKLPMRNVVKIDYGSKFPSAAKLLFGSIVGCEHDFFANISHPRGKFKLSHG